MAKLHLRISTYLKLVYENLSMYYRKREKGLVYFITVIVNAK
jgi:hypothetical protein